jgi:hypothetical protein
LLHAPVSAVKKSAALPASSRDLICGIFSTDLSASFFGLSFACGIFSTSKGSSPHFEDLLSHPARDGQGLASGCGAVSAVLGEVFKPKSIFGLNSSCQGIGAA